MSAIPDPLHAAAQARPDAPAILAPAGRVTYAALDRQVSLAADALRRDGLAPGDRLAIHRPQAADTLVLMLAAWRLGAVAAPISPRVPEGGVPGLLAALGGGVRLLGPGDPPPGAGAPPPPSSPDPPPWRLDRPATIVFTSGSTGTPKAALHTLGNHVWSARGWAERLPLAPGDRWLLDLPVAHVGGLAVLVRCVLAGAAVVLPERGAPFTETAARFGVTHASLVATQLRRALEGGGEGGGLRLVLLGGSALPESLVREAHARGWPVCTSYGLTEMASTVTSTVPGGPPEALATAGGVLPHREVRIAADGEILVRGRTRFAGYLAPGGGLETPFDAEGWFATGDLGAWEGGWLRVAGRKDNLFISGGENVRPEAVEAALLALPGVRQAVVVPVPDAEFGQRPVAFVEAEPWEPEAWRDALPHALPRFMVPDAFLPWPEGASAGLKPSRGALRAEAERLAGRGEISRPGRNRGGEAE